MPWKQQWYLHQNKSNVRVLFPRIIQPLQSTNLRNANDSAFTWDERTQNTERKRKKRRRTMDALSEFSEEGLLRIAARDFALPSTRIWSQATTSQIERQKSKEKKTEKAHTRNVSNVTCSWESSSSCSA